MNEQISSSAQKNVLILGSLSLGIFWVVFLWGFWTRGIHAMGFNASVFSLGVLGIFLFYAKAKGVLKFGTNWFWIIPCILISLSFSFYENPFLKRISFFILPAVLTIFINIAMHENFWKTLWTPRFGAVLFNKMFNFGEYLGAAFAELFNFILPRQPQARTIFKKIFIGLIIFLPLAFLFFVPLLSSADQLFGELIDNFYRSVGEVISLSSFFKIIMSFLIAGSLLCLLFTWIVPSSFSEKIEKRQFDGIISGIVLGGILVLYLLFIWTQIESFWSPTLPRVFKETETFVKSGFWELFILSAVNVFLYFIYYNRSSESVSYILKSFSVASFLLLVSASQRIYLYVTLYGFSYEKFFAAYTVLYEILLFGVLVFLVFNRRKYDIVKFLAISFIWMYSLITIFPVEQLVFKANAALSRRPESRIDLYELRILSNDVLHLVESYSGGEEWKMKWSPWREKQLQRSADKSWFEKNLGNVLE